MRDGSTVLVTGGAGFIGSELVAQIAATGAAVTVLDNLATGTRANLAALDPRQVRLVEGDIRDGAAVAEALRGVGVVYHLACLGVRHSLHSPAENHAVNASGTLALLEAARRAGVGRFVHVSSSEVYGTARWAPITEEHPTFPTTVYGAGKLAGECYARAYFTSYGLPTVVVRPFNSFGPRSHHEGDSGEVIPKFMLRALAGLPMVVFGDGSQTRDFTYVSDTARGILLAGQVDAAVGSTLNLGQGRETSVHDLAMTIRQVLGLWHAPVEYDRPRPGDVLRLYADSTLAGRLLGFAPTVALAEGLALLRRWYAEQGTPPEQLLAQERVHNWEPLPAPDALVGQRRST